LPAPLVREFVHQVGAVGECLNEAMRGMTTNEVPQDNVVMRGIRVVAHL
jgi:hypothetical protein